MSKVPVRSGVFLMLWLAGASFALAQQDGVTLRVAKDVAPGSVSLTWMGGQPLFQVFRSTDKTHVVAPENKLGETLGRVWGDAPPVGVVQFYRITSPCVVAPPEVTVVSGSKIGARPLKSPRRCAAVGTMLTFVVPSSFLCPS